MLARLVSGVAVVFATAALAASGDALLVDGNNVNVRAGPSTDAGILTRVDRDEPAIERRRQGQWVEIDLPVRNVRGWIHGSLLTAAPAEPVARGVEEAAAPAPTDVAGLETGALAMFRRDVEYFNNRAVAAAGVDLFTDVAPLDDGGVQVVTTEAWATMGAQGQQSYGDALFRRWRAAAGDDPALHLQIVNPDGVVVMERSGP